MPSNSRRTFLTGIAAGIGTMALAPAIKADFEKNTVRLFEYMGGRTPDELAADEKFWAEIRKGFDLPADILNLDNGYCNPLSKDVVDDLVLKAKYVQELPGKRVETLYDEVSVPDVIGGLGRITGVPATEIALVRNATEALDTVILGLPMKAGDEILCCTHDYYAMLDAIEQRQKRDRIVVKMISPPLRPSSPDVLVDLYERALSPKTRLVLLTHASNMTGQVYPVKAIADAAHRVGAEVLVDGAQTLALMDHKIPDLNCDYYGASLHKWLMAPIGAGMLWMRKQHVEKIWPLVPSPAYAKGMLKFSWSGTYPEFISASAARAIKFYEKLGPARKEARIRYLTNYWRGQIERLPGVRFYTTASDWASCGLGIFEWAGVDLEAVQKKLWEDDKILVQFMGDFADRAPELRGMRVTPNIYTSTAELDRYVATLKKVAAG